MTPTDTARAWLSDPDCVVLDFETTGWVGVACEVAIVDMAGEVLFNARLWPNAPMDPGAERAHGITMDSLVGEPTWNDIVRHVAECLHRRTVLTYGVTFDRGVLERENKRHGTVLVVPREWRCAMQLYRQWLGEPRAVKLPGGDHSALGDCRAALEVLRRVAAGPAPTARYR